MKNIIAPFLDTSCACWLFAASTPDSATSNGVVIALLLLILALMLWTIIKLRKLNRPKERLPKSESESVGLQAAQLNSFLAKSQKSIGLVAGELAQIQSNFGRLIQDTTEELRMERDNFYQLARQMLLLIDSYDGALSSPNLESFEQGFISNARLNLITHLRCAGIHEMKTTNIGRPFDPGRERSVGEKEACQAAGTILEVKRAGFELHRPNSLPAVLRPAEVLLSSGPPDAKTATAPTALLEIKNIDSNIEGPQKLNQTAQDEKARH